MKNGYDVADEQEWLDEQRERFISYLLTQNIDVRKRKRRIRWSLPPKVSLWSIQLPRQDCVWVISGDVPTDYIFLDETVDSREVMFSFCNRWDEVSAILKTGKQHPTIRIGEGESASQLEELGSLLSLRAQLLRKWANDNAKWELGLS
jgi:hypothetical protein